MQLENKVAVVTGASSGIGKAIVKKLSEKGCRVVLASRSLDKLKVIKAGLKGETMVVELDVTDSESVSKAFEKINNEFGKVDILVNNAGVMPLTYLKNEHLEEWLKTIDVNVKGVLRCMQAVLPGMIDRKDGHIVNIASIDGKEFYKGGAVYSASKAAIIALSRAMRLEVSSEYNIRVTCIEPGTVDTDLRGDISDKEFEKNQDWDDNEAKLKPEEIADGILYALSQPESVNVNELLITPTRA
ncbi:SDR family oxidoreductase [Cryomorpha ignava]|uniref:SDR family oxidoreductase n=1 Tax=Cryomorpha ignava TaxID=101383 RepID=A0A7K3WVI3_9FLAO|nr:SDR family oxidoreductase [Cryomorpha ignava]NEN25061.1 SDR family oxidoreductase [Cryomorpha ignava]